ncbi:MAG: hypothetical protein R6W76_23910 [Caldilinea sp.]
MSAAGSRFMIVPQEERVVLYRLGRFSRLAGPGLVTLDRLDTEERRINVRSDVEDYRTNTYYFINGVPFNYTISFWSRNDLLEAAGVDLERLAELAQYTDDERQRHLLKKLHEAMYACTQRIQKKCTVAEDSSIAGKLLPILPGMPGCDDLRELVTAHLRQNLPTIGVILDTRHPVMVANVHVTPEVLDSFTRGRSLTMLREQLHDVSPDLLVQAFSAIEGLDMHTVRLYMEGNAAVRDVRLDGDSITGYKVIPQPPVEQLQRSEMADSPLRKVAMPADSEEERLSKADLGVLKRLPASNAQRIAG